MPVRVSKTLMGVYLPSLAPPTRTPPGWHNHADVATPGSLDGQVHLRACRTSPSPSLFPSRLVSHFCTVYAIWCQIPG